MHSRAERVRRVREGQAPRAVAAALGVDIKTVKTRVARFEAEGRAGLADRSSRRHRLNNPTTDAICAHIVELRRQRWTGKQIAKQAKVSTATVGRVLARAGLSRMRDLAPAEPVVRYEDKTPGGLLHLDIKKLGRFERTGHRITGKRTGVASSRGSGWEFVHVCSEDASRVAFSQILPDKKRRAPSPSSRPPWPTPQALASPSPG
jgi:transposase